MNKKHALYNNPYMEVDKSGPNFIDYVFIGGKRARVPSPEWEEMCCNSPPNKWGTSFVEFDTFDELLFLDKVRHRTSPWGECESVLWEEWWPDILGYSTWPKYGGVELSIHRGESRFDCEATSLPIGVIFPCDDTCHQELWNAILKFGLHDMGRSANRAASTGLANYKIQKERKEENLKRALKKEKKKKVRRQLIKK